MAFIDDIQSRDTALFPVVEIRIPQLNDIPVPMAELIQDMDDFYDSGFYPSTDWSGFEVGQYIKIDNEIMRIWLIVGGYVIRVHRGLFNTDIVSHSIGAIVYRLGWINISTKDFTLDNTHYNPLLLSTPSIKESIDLENRKYKISNVSLKISNVEYNGERFSDSQITLNTEVLIHWVSPSCTVIDDCYLAYKGTVRATTHDERTCNITLEDISQSTLHRDVPVTLLGTGIEVPSKWKNKPIPMVYGSVDYSPCVASGYYDEERDLVSIDTIYCDDKPIKTTSLESDAIEFGNNVIPQSIISVENNGSSYINCSILSSTSNAVNFESNLETNGSIAITSMNNQTDSGSDRVFAQIIRDSIAPAGMYNSSDYTIWWGNPDNALNITDRDSSTRMSTYDKQVNEGDDYEGFIWWDNVNHQYYHYLSARVSLKEFALPDNIDFNTYLVIKWECTNSTASSGDLQLVIWAGESAPQYDPNTNIFIHGHGAVFATPFNVADDNTLHSYNNFDGSHGLLSLGIDDVVTYANQKSINFGIPNLSYSGDYSTDLGAYFSLHVYEMHILHKLFVYDLLQNNYYVNIEGRTSP